MDLAQSSKRSRFANQLIKSLSEFVRVARGVISLLVTILYQLLLMLDPPGPKLERLGAESGGPSKPLPSVPS
jgi:hypothetical protein